MTPEIIRLVPQVGHRLLVEFKNGEAKIFDATPYLDKGIFTELRNPDYFALAEIIPGGVGWPNEQDLSADTLYLRGVSCEPGIISGALV